MLRYNGMMNELAPLNSSTRRGLDQNFSRKVFTMLSHNRLFQELIGIKPVKFEHQAENKLKLSRKSLC